MTYVSGAKAGDRFFGMPCGCVVLARDYDSYADGVMVPSEMYYQHVGEDPCGFKYINPVPPFVNLTTAVVYLYTLEMLTADGKLDGLRWQ